MVYVLTVDQRRSRRGADRVELALGRLRDRGLRPLRAFERTAGDEFQGVLADAGEVVDAVLTLARDGGWSVGIGIGPVEQPLPETTRAGRGPAFERARSAVERAKRRPQRLAVDGDQEEAARDAETALALLVALLDRRSPAAWEAVDLAARGATPAQAAAALGVTRQAVGQRLATALWPLEHQARPLAARLLARADVAAPPVAAGDVGARAAEVAQAVSPRAEDAPS